MHVQLIDDGTFDTVIKVNDKVFRFTNTDDLMPYPEFIEWAKKDAVEQYQEMLAN